MSKLVQQDDLVLDVEPALYYSVTGLKTAITNNELPLLPAKQTICTTSIDNLDDKDICSAGTSAITKATLTDSPNSKSKNSLNCLSMNSIKAKFINITQGYANFPQSTIEDPNGDISQIDDTDKRHNTSLEEDNETEHEGDSVDNVKLMGRAKSASGLRTGSKRNLVSTSFCEGNRSRVKPTVAKNLDQTQRSYSSVRYGHRLDTGQSSPDRSMRLRTEEADMSNHYNSNVHLTKNMQKVVEERKEMVRHFKKQGVQKYENKVLRQEMERQMRTMENRVKRLKIEEDNIQRNIRRTEDAAKKAMNTKRRYQDDLNKLEEYKQRKHEEEMKAREKAQQEKLKRITGLRTNVLSMHIKKAVAANQVKNDYHQHVADQNEVWKKEEERRMKAHQSTIELEKNLRVKKEIGQKKAKNQMDENHKKFLQQEHLRTLDIESKMKELARKEAILIDRIKSTHQLQIKAETTMRHVLSTKVEPTKPLEF